MYSYDRRTAARHKDHVERDESWLHEDRKAFKSQAKKLAKQLTDVWEANGEILRHAKSLLSNKSMKETEDFKEVQSGLTELVAAINKAESKSSDFYALIQAVKKAVELHT